MLVQAPVSETARLIMPPAEVHTAQGKKNVITEDVTILLLNAVMMLVLGVVVMTLAKKVHLYRLVVISFPVIQYVTVHLWSSKVVPAPLVLFTMPLSYASSRSRLSLTAETFSVRSKVPPAYAGWD